MQEKASRSWIVALAISLGLHLLVLGLLYFLRLRSEVEPKPREEVVLIDLGNVASAAGAEEPSGQQVEGETIPSEASPTPASQPRVEPTPVAKPEPKKPEPRPEQQPIRTQTHEPAPKQAPEPKPQPKDAKKPTPPKPTQPTAEELRAQAEAKARAEAEERAKRMKQVGNSVAQAFGAGKGRNTSHGNSQGSGNQGDPEGVTNGSFSLEGRRVISNGGQLTSPKVNKAIEGRIVVNIVVNSRGEVSSATISPRGTNIADPSVRNGALAAARSTTFNAQEGGAEQRGTITYIYVLKD